MHQPARFVASLTEISVIGTTCSAARLAYGSGTAAADGSTMAPLSINLKRCDSSNTCISNIFGVPPATRQTTYVGIMRTSVRVTPETHLVEAAPDTICGLKFVERPRWVVDGGDNYPGVIVSALNIESAGNATATVQESVMPGAIGAWVSVDRRFLLGGERFDGGG
jgi:hypothetical protein